jgi:hypothetical protein
MSAGFLALLGGVFVVPAILLASGRHLRRLPLPQRRAFWGAVIGHGTAATLALVAGMIPPEAWTPDESARGFFGWWSLLLFPIAGALVGVLTADRGH